MASDGHPVQIPAISLVHGSHTPTAATVPTGGKVLPPPGKPSAAPAPTDARTQVALLNKFLNDTGKPDQFRVAPDSDDKLIQQINPANGAVLGVFPVSEFAALARSVGISGVIVNQHA